MENAQPVTLKIGDEAPDFALMNQDKQVIKLSDFRGKKKVILLFYPMDFSPVCTGEHCAFSPDKERLEKDGDAVVFGVSTDSPYCHAAYKKQYNITYDLLADVTRSMCKAYGMFAGETPFNCSKRGTVIVNKDGTVGFQQEIPIPEARKMDDLEQASLIADEIANRQDEFGVGV